jgi:hypothetical protein
MYHQNFQVHHENQKPGHLDMVQWIVLANDAIAQANVTNTWRHVGITHPELNQNENTPEDKVVLTGIDSDDGGMLEEIDPGGFEGEVAEHDVIAGGVLNEVVEIWV